MTPETIHSYYAKDHDRLDELFKQYQFQKRIDFPKAKKAFLEFKQGLEQHIVWEEEVLFPFFEGKTGMKDCGPTEVMRQEHREIKATLEQMKEKVHCGDANTDNEERKLLGVLGNHNAKEESILYPMIDQMAETSDRDAIFKKMKETIVKSGCCCL